MATKKNEKAEKSPLFYTNKNVFDTISAGDESRCAAYAEEYKRFLDAAKTEREAVAEAIRLAEGCGYRPLGKKKPVPGDRIYKSVGGKLLFLAAIGKKPLEDGVNIAAAHVDSPRLDLKQLPLYEDSELALLKTHYYGGLKKYQWVALPLALHGVVIKKDGAEVPVVIGEAESDPVLMVTDLLPHLGKDQLKKTLSEAFTGENLNIVFGSKPTGGEKDSDRFKLTVLEYLNSNYGIDEEDLISGELIAVPAGRARDVGLDRSLMTAYGHDDRSCAFAALRALLDAGAGAPKGIPARSAVCILADKEEIGSDGVSGMQSQVFEHFMYALTGDPLLAATCFGNSFCLSADVCNGFDPNFPEVSEKNNSAKLNHGMGIMKFTGHGGKSGSSDASAEVVAEIRRIFADNGVAWQMTELGKVDQGGGGTVAKYMANRGIATIDAGVPVLSMHAPWEIVSKIDCYMTYKGIRAVFETR
jgi:aspartyl aminopeptidase